MSAVTKSKRAKIENTMFNSVKWLQDYTTIFFISLIDIAFGKIFFAWY